MPNSNEVVENANVETVEKVDTQPKEAETFTQAELNKILAKEKAKWKRDEDEAKRLAEMNAEEKARYQYEQKENDLKKRLAEVQKRELTATAKEMLADVNLPQDLHTLLNYESAETVKESVNTLQKALKSKVEEMVNQRLKGSVPTKPTTQGDVLSQFELGAKLR